MSQVTPTTIPLRNQLRSHWTVTVSALLALLATAAVVLVLVLDNESADTGSVAQSSQPALRSDGGPDESAVAASVGSAQPPESKAYVSESRIAASLSTVPEPQPAGPDESKIAASIAGH